MKRAKMFVVFLVMVSMMLSNYTGLQHVHAEEAEEESIEETAEETEELSSEVEDGNSNTEIEWVDEPAEFSEPAAYTISDNWNYQIVNGILTIRGTGSIDDFSYNNLPPWYSRRSEIDWVEMQNGITRIGAFAFYGLTNVTRVTLSKNLISIGAHAFDSCKGITQIVIPDGVTTLGDEDELGNGGYVFANSGLTSISLPDSITNIENGCFMNCKDLASVSLPSHLTAVKKDLFSGCSNLTSVYIPSSVTTIELAAFYECTSLTTVAVGSSVTELGRRVFQDCTQLSEVILPKGIETIGQWAFDACTSLRTVKYGGTQTDWSNITIADGNTKLSSATRQTEFGYNVLFETPDEEVLDQQYVCYGVTPVYNGPGLPTLSNPAEGSFCVGWDKDIVPCEGDTVYTAQFESSLSGTCGEDVYWTLDSDGVLSISGSGDMEDYKVSSSTNANTLISCSSTASWYDYRQTIQEVYIESGVTSIGRGSFVGCTELTNISLPETITDLGEYAFVYCDSLTNLPVFPEGVNTIPASCFLSCMGLTNITIPNTITEIGSSAFGYCTNLTNVSLPNTITTLTGFRNCTGLTSVTIPESVTTIGGAAFWGCTGLVEITIPESVTSIEYHAFRGCTGLTAITIPGNVTTIGGSAFAYCSSIEEITLSEGIISIGEYAFWGCSEVTAVTIPDSVEVLSGFVDCTGLTEIIIPESVTTIGESAFWGCTGLTEIVIPENVTTIDYGAFGNCTGLTEISLPHRITEIADETFSGCTGLTSITIPKSVTVIGYAAFSGCSQLTDVYYTGTESDWNNIGIDWDNDVLSSVTKHYLDLTWTVDHFEWTATDSGYTAKAIFVNDKTDETIIVNAVVSEETTDPTCLDDGAIVYTASVDAALCPDGEPHEDVKTEVIESSGHQWGVEWVWTETENGYSAEAVYTCENCDESLTLSAYVTSTVTPATCQTYGNIVYIASIAAAAAPNNVAAMDTKTIILEQLTHNEEIMPSQDPTCTETGLTEGSQCSLCGEILIAQEVIPALGHAWEYDEIVWTEIEGGYSAKATYHCERCDETEEADAEVSVEVTEPTYTSEGQKVYTAWISADNSFDGNRHEDIKTIVIPVLEITGECGDNLVWSLSNEGILTISGSGMMYDYSAAEPAPWSGYTEEITSIIVEEGATSIGSNAFNGFESVQFANIPKSVVLIGENAFNGCNSFSTINYAGSRTLKNEIDIRDTSEAFTNAEWIYGEILLLDEGACGDNVNYAFYDDGSLKITGSGEMASYSIGRAPWYSYKSDILSVRIYSGVTSIGTYTFANCKNITAITIPRTVKTIYDKAFAYCSGLTNVTYASNERAWSHIDNQDTSGILENCEYAFGTPIIIESVSNVYALYDDGLIIVYSDDFVCQNYDLCDRVFEARINPGITKIDTFAFQFCDKLESVSIPDSVTWIRFGAFAECTNLSSVNIPDSVTELEGIIFLNCSSLTSIVIPDSISKIDGIFEGCSSLVNVILPENLTYIGGYTFAYCSSLESIEIPENVTCICNGCFRECSNLVTVVLHENITTIGDSAFDGCANLVNITIPENVTSIGDYAFLNCFSIPQINIPDTLTEIGNATFAGLRSITELTIPDTVQIIGREAFGGCYNVKSIIIPDNVTSIGEVAFHDCISLESIIIPANVTTIGNDAFRNCTNLETVEILGEITSIGSLMFYECSSLTNITLPDSIESIGDYAFYHCSKLSSIIIPDGVYSIGEQAFNGCESLTKIVIPESVTSIGFYAFIGCDHLVNIWLPNTFCDIDPPSFFPLNENTDTINVYFAGSEEEWNDLEYESLFKSDLNLQINFDCIYSTSSGNCEETVTWTKYVDGTLVLSGSGSIDEYADVTDIPWYGKKARIKHIVIEDGITNIPAHLFDDYPNLVSVEIGDTVTEIGDYAFSMCGGLTSIKVGAGTEYIGEGAFFACDHATEVILPHGLLYIGEDAFLGCDSISTVKYGGNPDEWEEMIQIEEGNDSLLEAERVTSFGYDITFVTPQGEVLQESIIIYGDLPIYMGVDLSTLSNQETNEYCVGWDREIKRSSEDATYTARIILLEISYDWTEDGNGYVVTATAVNEDEEYSLNETVAATVSNHTDATCEERATNTYTATFAEYIFQPQTQTFYQGDPLGHSWVYNTIVWTETEDGYTAKATYYCSRCGETEEAAAEVSMMETPATCVAEGQKVYTAAVGEETSLDETEHSDTKTVTIEKLPHVWQTEWTWNEIEDGYSALITYTCENCQETVVIDANVSKNVTEATCSAEGSIVYTATILASETPDHYARTTNKTITIEKLAHTEETIPAVPATCTETGLTEGTKCSVCGEILVAQEETPALGHDWTYEGIVWNETEDGYTAKATYHCSRCEETEEAAAEVTMTETPATCTAAGQKVYTAVVDENSSLDETGHSDTKTVTIEKLPHAWQTVWAWTETEDGYSASITYTCENCQETVDIDANVSKTVTEATCSAEGSIVYTATIPASETPDHYARTTNKTITIEKLAHTEETIPAVAATCTETGLTEGKKCSICGEILVAQEETPALGHSEEILQAVDPTCTETGLTEGKKCSVCGEILVAQEEIPALGHTEEILSGQDATCTETGLTEGKKCSVCGETLVAQEVIPALGHTEEILPGQAATCTETGLTEGKKCSVCGETLVEQEVIPALGHEWGEWTVTTPATCTEDGEEQRVCGHDSTHKETRTIEAHGHTVVLDPAVDPTFTETGLTEGSHCSVCETVLVPQEIIPILVGIMTEPEDVTILAGHSVHFTVETNIENAEYQWQYSANGGETWTDSPSTGNETDTLSVNTSVGMNGRLYRCQIMCGDAVLTSRAALLTVQGIKTQPSDQSVSVGETVSINIVTTVSPDAYQWQYSTDGGTTWTNSQIVGSTGDTLSFAAASSMSGRLYRCQVTFGDSVLTSRSVELIVQGIITQPTEQTVVSGKKAIFSIEATEGAAYQWQYSTNDGSSWTNSPSSGNQTNTVTVNASASMNGRLYRCLVTYGDDVELISDEVLLTVQGIKTQPTAQTAVAGNKVTFSIITTAEGAAYQWQYSTNGGSSWTNSPSSGNQTDTVTVNASAAMDGRLYRCLVTYGDTVLTSKSAALTVQGIKIQPTAQTAVVGEKVTFTVVATEGATYQWQYSTNSGSTWTNSPSTGNKTATVTVNTSAGMNGRLYRCVVSYGETEIISKTAKLTVKGIKTQPTAQTVVAGEKVTFTVVTTVSGATYQWQYSTDGSTWINSPSSGNKTATVTVNSNAAMNGRQYRCKVIYGDTELISKAVKLTVKGIKTQPKATTVTSGEKATFTVVTTVTGATYQWQYSTNGGSTWVNSPSSGNKTATVTINSNASMNGRLYRCLVTYGDTVLTSSTAKLTVK